MPNKEGPPRRRTRLESLVDEHVGVTLTATIGLAVEKVAAEIARDALADETFRRVMRELIQRRAAALLEDLLAPNGTRRRRRS
jgi:hypothetical protein